MERMLRRNVFLRWRLNYDFRFMRDHNVFGCNTCWLGAVRGIVESMLAYVRIALYIINSSIRSSTYVILKQLRSSSCLICV